MSKLNIYKKVNSKCVYIYTTSSVPAQCDGGKLLYKRKRMYRLQPLNTSRIVVARFLLIANQNTQRRCNISVAVLF